MVKIREVHVKGEVIEYYEDGSWFSTNFEQGFATKKSFWKILSEVNELLCLKADKEDTVARMRRPARLCKGLRK